VRKCCFLQIQLTLGTVLPFDKYFKKGRIEGFHRKIPSHFSKLTHGNTVLLSVLMLDQSSLQTASHKL
jgi:hypothetical protein